MRGADDDGDTGWTGDSRLLDENPGLSIRRLSTNGDVGTRSVEVLDSECWEMVGLWLGTGILAVRTAPFLATVESSLYRNSVRKSN